MNPRTYYITNIEKITTELSAYCGSYRVNTNILSWSLIIVILFTSCIGKIPSSNPMVPSLNTISKFDCDWCVPYLSVCGSLVVNGNIYIWKNKQIYLLKGLSNAQTVVWFCNILIAVHYIRSSFGPFWYTVRHASSHSVFLLFDQNCLR